jgi:ribosomal protein S14
MIKKNQKDKKNRLTFFQHEEKRKILKSISQNTNLSTFLRWKAGLDLSILPKNSSLTKLKNRCIFTGRSRSVLGKFNMSRLMLRKLAREGSIPGLRKSSW